MQVSDERAVKLLNSLIETTLDSANGYREAAEHTTNPQFKQMFADRAQRRERLSRRLQEEVRTFGGKPEDDQSLMGKLHNKFVGLKEKMAGGSDKAVIDEVERGEDMIKAKYQKAAEEPDLPPTLREFVRTACAEVKAEHDEISRIKHQMH